MLSLVLMMRMWTNVSQDNKKHIVLYNVYAAEISEQDNTESSEVTEEVTTEEALTEEVTEEVTEENENEDELIEILNDILLIQTSLVKYSVVQIISILLLCGAVLAKFIFKLR